MEISLSDIFSYFDGKIRPIIEGETVLKLCQLHTPRAEIPPGTRSESQNEVVEKVMAVVVNPASHFSTMESGYDWVNAPHSTGTTIVAAEFDGGVVIGADSRTTTGVYIANRVTDKLTKITDSIYCCRSGSAADTQAIADIVAYNLNFHALELGEPPLVETGAAVFRELCYNYRDSLMAGILIAGWDKRKGGQVYAVPIGGMCVRQAVSIGGSGSTYVYGYVDANYRKGMNKEECVKFMTNTLALAMSRDGSSGGVCRLGIITEEGIERRVVLGNELPKFYED